MKFTKFTHDKISNKQSFPDMKANNNTKGKYI